MIKDPNAKMALRAVVPLLLAFMALTTMNYWLIGLFAVALCIWIWELTQEVPADQVHTWWVGDGDGNGTTVCAADSTEAIAKVAQETFDLRAEHVGVGVIE